MIIRFIARELVLLFRIDQLGVHSSLGFKIFSPKIKEMKMEREYQTEKKIEELSGNHLHLFGQKEWKNLEWWKRDPECFLKLIWSTWEFEMIEQIRTIRRIIIHSVQNSVLLCDGKKFFSLILFFFIHLLFPFIPFYLALFCSHHKIIPDSGPRWYSLFWF